MLRLPLVKTRYIPNEGDSTRLSVMVMGRRRERCKGKRMKVIVRANVISIHAASPSSRAATGDPGRYDGVHNVGVSVQQLETNAFAFTRS